MLVMYKPLFYEQLTVEYYNYYFFHLQEFRLETRISKQ